MVGLAPGTRADSRAAQVEAVKKVYAGPRNPRTGEQIIAGYSPGSESPAGDEFEGGWKTYITGRTEPMRLDFWRYWVFNDAAWDWRTFDYDRNVAYADEKLAVVNASSPDLHAFQERGGKILVYSGWADPVGPRCDQLLRARPGGDGRETKDRIVHALVHGALVRWVEKGSAPDKIIATHLRNNVIDRTRPLCPYPKSAHWNGRGSSDDARSFTCAETPRRD